MTKKELENYVSSLLISHNEIAIDSDKIKKNKFIKQIKQINKNEFLALSDVDKWTLVFKTLKAVALEDLE